MLKKGLKILGIFLLLLVAAAIILPIVFEDEIVEKVKEEANNNLNAKVDFGDFSLSLFSNFPNFTLSIDDVSVVGTGVFEGDTLAHIGTFEVSVDLMSVIGGMDPINVKSFGLVEPYIHVIVLKDGTANWDIAKPTGDTVETPAGEPSSFNLSLQKYYIENAHIIYDDSASGVYAELVNFNHEGNGDFTQDLFVLNTETQADAVTVIHGGIPYLSKVKIDLKIDLEMDMPNMKFTFSENEIQLNYLFLGFDGYLSIPGDDIEMDIKFNARQTEFKNILSLVPAVFARDFESVKTSGKLALNGYVKGTSNENTIPGFGLNLKVEDAMFQYPGLPKAAKNIQIAVKVNNPGGDVDNTVVDVSVFHVELAGQPLDMKLKVKTPVSDPDIDCTIRSQLNLANLKDVIPMEEGESYSGSITADIKMKGRLSAIEKGRYEQFAASGQVILLDMKYEDPATPYDMHIKKMYLNFSPQFVELSTFESTLGKNDIKASGKIENLLAYYFKDEALKGRFDMQSKLLDLNTFMTDTEEESSAGEGGEDAELSVFEVPGNIDFTMSASIGKLIYDNLTMTNVTGSIIIRNKEILLRGLKMNALDGKLAVSGSYSTKNARSPAIDFDINIQNVDIQKTYQTFETVQKMAPIAENCTGKISTTMKLKGLLDEKMEPVMSSLSGGGNLTTHQVVVKNSGVLSKVADALKMDQYRNLKLDNVNISYKFSDGRVVVEPFDIALATGKAVVSGSNGFDETIAYVMNLDIPTGSLGSAATGALGSIANKSGGKFNVGDKLNIDVLIGGTVSKPTITTGLKGAASDLVEDIKETIKEEIEEKKEEIKEEVKEEVSKKAEQLIKDAEKKAASLKAEAKRVADKVRKEGYANAGKLEKEAKNPIAKIAAKKAAEKMRKETDKKANSIISTANKKANAVMDEARRNAEKLK